MTALFFRDGRPYSEGRVPHTFKPVRGEARISVYDTCGKCKGAGRIGHTPYDIQCRRCLGMGHERNARNVTVYTLDRLDYLNNKDRGRLRHSVSTEALRTSREDFKAFVRSRDALITRIIELAALSSTLQRYESMISEGVILSPGEIRNAQALIEDILHTARRTG